MEGEPNQGVTKGVQVRWDCRKGVQAWSIPERGSRRMRLELVGSMVMWSPTAFVFFFFQAEDGIRDVAVIGVQTCALPISWTSSSDSFVRDLKSQRLNIASCVEEAAPWNSVTSRLRYR